MKGQLLLVLAYLFAIAPIAACERVSPDLPPVLIAHAGGRIGKLTYTNSREALDENYKKGFRYFELDFEWTADGHLVLIHDWFKSWRELYGSAPPRAGLIPPTLETFKKATMRNGLTSMTLDSLLIWLEKKPGAFIVTDIKHDNIKALTLIRQHAGPLAARFVPQIYNFNEYADVSRLKYSRIILTLYRMTVADNDVLQFAKANPLFAITLPVQQVFASDLSARLSRMKVPTYAHTVNRKDNFEALKSRRITGIYTDVLSPKELM